MDADVEVKVTLGSISCSYKDFENLSEEVLFLKSQIIQLLLPVECRYLKWNGHDGCAHGGTVVEPIKS